MKLTFSSIAASTSRFFGSKMTYLIAFIVFAAKMPIINAAFPKPKLRIDNGAEVVLAEGTNLMAKGVPQMVAVEVIDSNTSGRTSADVGTSLIVTGGNYFSEQSQAFRLNGAGASTTICGGTIQGGESVAFAFPDVGTKGEMGVLAAGSSDPNPNPLMLMLQIGGGSITGGNSTGDFPAGPAVLVRSTNAIIAGGTLQGGYDEQGVQGYSLDIDLSNNNIQISGGSFNGNWKYNGESDVTIYGKKDLVLEGNNLKGHLCDGSTIDVDIDGLNSGGKVVVINDCSSAPSVEECGNSNKSSKAGKAGGSSNVDSVVASAAVTTTAATTTTTTTKAGKPEGSSNVDPAAAAAAASSTNPSSMPSSQPSSSDIFD